MSSSDSTHRNALHATMPANLRQAAQAVAKKVRAECEAGAIADLSAALEAYPILSADKSIFLDLVEWDFRRRSDNQSTLTPHEYCAQFRSLPNDYWESAYRLVEVHQFFGQRSLEFPALPQPRWPEAGTTYEGFEIEEELGRGATARVFICREQRVGGRRVVLKVSTLLRSEAAVLGRFSHQNVATIHSTGVDHDRGFSWICMPFVSRWTLRHLLPASFPRDLAALKTNADSPQAAPPWTLRQRIHLACGLCAGLDHIHSHQVLHGDIKPSNILVTDALEPVLIDFNLAHNQEQSLALLGGTLPYMAPELLRSLQSTDESPQGVTAATEIYALGAVLYELMTGRPLNAGVSAANTREQLVLLSNKLSEPQIVTIRLDRRIDEELMQLIARCVAPNPLDRESSVQPVWQALQSIERRLQPYRWSHLLGRKRFWAATFLGVGALIGSATMLMTPEEPLALAARLKETGNLASAVQVLQTAAMSSVNARDPEFLRGYGRTLLAARRYDDALLVLEQLDALTEEPQDLALLAYCFNLRKQHDVAMAFYRRLWEIKYDSPAISGNAASTMFEQLNRRFEPRASAELGQFVLAARERYPADAGLAATALRHADLEAMRKSEPFTPYDVRGIIASFDSPPVSLLMLAIAYYHRTIANDQLFLSAAQPLVTRLESQPIPVVLGPAINRRLGLPPEAAISMSPVGQRSQSSSTPRFRSSPTAPFRQP